MFDRRTFGAAIVATAAASCVPLDTSSGGRLAAKLRIIEAAAGGTLGVAILDVASGRMTGLNSVQMFGHCSSFKLSLAALLLAQSRLGELDRDELVRWTAQDLLPVSPFTTERLSIGATLLELTEATQTFSDNTAANLMLARLGGPEGMTQFWRAIGDVESRLDRTEPQLNDVPEGEVRDTTTPAAMAGTVASILFGGVLSPDDAALLREWTAKTQTGLRRVRAGLPETWDSGDKTGTAFWPGKGSIYVDIGWTQPPGDTPVTFATYYRSEGDGPSAGAKSEAVLSQVGRVVADFAQGAA